MKLDSIRWISLVAVAGALAAGPGCEARVTTDQPPPKVEIESEPKPNVDVNIEHKPRGLDVDVNVDKSPP
ncbi:MAG TPA: hypothetical protein VFV87_03085 [Pirellulaceae bacterium]|nr:hypothetical protein [Pirellulaceae bacterium]